MHVFSDEPVDFRRGSIVWQAGVDDYRFCARLWGEVAFVADAHDFPVKPEREKNLGRRRQQRNDAHGEGNSSTNSAPRKNVKEVKEVHERNLCAPANSTICRENTCGESGRKRQVRWTSLQRFSRVRCRTAAA